MDHALESFFREQTWLRTLARSLVRDDADVDDLVQETWLAALQNPPKNPEDPRRWLRVVVKRLAARRRARRELELAEPDARLGGEALPDAAAARWEASTLLREAIDELPEPERAVVLLRYQEEGSLEEVAAALGVSSRTVSERLRAAKSRLRIRLGDRFEADEFRHPAWLAALAPLVEADEWLAAVARRLGSVAGKAGVATSWVPAGGLLWKALTALVLTWTGAWVFTRSPAPPSPNRTTSLAAADVPGPAAGGPGPALEGAADDRAGARVRGAEAASPPAAEALAAAPLAVGRVRVSVSLRSEGGTLEDYRVRLAPPAGSRAFAGASAPLSERGRAVVELQRPSPAPEAGPVTLVIEPDPEVGRGGATSGRPSFLLELQPGDVDVDVDVELALEFVAGDHTLELALPVDPADLADPAPRTVTLERALAGWARPKCATGPWSARATAVVRRGRAEFRGLPIGVYEVDSGAGSRGGPPQTLEIRP